jgi:predicted NAD-dependent protein-ADP-ribosyltransferase YbiA (DUF1768 family)
VERFPFSSFQHARVTCDLGVAYPTVEHAYQAMKTTDRAERERVAPLPAPGQAKRAGRRLRLRDVLERTKVIAMLHLLRQKFAPGSEHAGAAIVSAPKPLLSLIAVLLLAACAQSSPPTSRT